MSAYCSNGTPRMNPLGSAGEAARAGAFSKSGMMSAFSSRSSLSIRAIAASTSSTGLTFRRCTRSACAVASRNANSSLIHARYDGRTRKVQGRAAWVLSYALLRTAPPLSPGASQATSRKGGLMATEPTPDRILDLGTGFWGSKALLSAVELGLFSELAAGPLERETLRERLGLHPRSARDFFDALVALGMLERRGDAYANTPETGLFLDRAKPTYVGGLLEMLNARLYGFWGSL